MAHWIYTLLGEEDLVRVKLGVENDFLIWLSRRCELLAIWAIDGRKAAAALSMKENICSLEIQNKMVRTHRCGPNGTRNAILHVITRKIVHDVAARLTPSSLLPPY